MMSSKVDFKSPIGLALCAICLKEFYNLYDNEGCGIITNTRSGAMLYDLLKWAGNDMSIDENIKKEVLENCKSDILSFQNGHLKRDLSLYKRLNKELSDEDFAKYHKQIWTKDKYKKKYEEFCKCQLAEIWLNIQVLSGKRINPNDIPIPKLNAQYHKFRLHREE